MSEQWSMKPIGEMCETIRGVTYRGDSARSTPGEGMIPLLRATNVKEGSLNFEGLVYVPERNVSTTQLLQAGDLVVVASSGSKAVVGKAAILPQAWRGTFGAFCLVVRPNQSKINPEFLSYYLQSSEYRGRISALAAGVNINNLRHQHIAELTLPVPNREQQDQTVAVLDSHLSRLDSATETLERVRLNLKRYRASVLKAAVAGRLVPTEAALARADGRPYEPASALLEGILEERRVRWKASGKKGKYREPAARDTANLPELPEGWCWATVEQLLTEELSNGRSVPDRAGGFPVLRLTALAGPILKLSESKAGAWTAQEAEPFLVREGDFLVSRGNGSIKRVGLGAIAPVIKQPIAYPDTLIRIRVAPNAMLPRLLTLIWNSYSVRIQIERAAKTTAGIFKINQGDLSKIVLPVAPLREQTRLLESLERLLTIADATEASVEADLARLKGLRSSILRSAFRGELVPNEATLA
ncbi:MAG: restriction endonuclease subunit S [Gemmatimonadales bacterium]